MMDVHAISEATKRFVAVILAGMANCEKLYRGHLIGPGRRSILTVHRRIEQSRRREANKYPNGHSHAREKARRLRQWGSRGVKVAHPAPVQAPNSDVDDLLYIPPFLRRTA